jgi:activator of 2-hydroxyglutaryl-CoA dehydratase
MNSYCSIFGIQDLVTSLASGHTIQDVAAAACHSCKPPACLRPAA